MSINGEEDFSWDTVNKTGSDQSINNLNTSCLNNITQTQSQSNFISILNNNNTNNIIPAVSQTNTLVSNNDLIVKNDTNINITDGKLL